MGEKRTNLERELLLCSEEKERAGSHWHCLQGDVINIDAVIKRLSGNEEGAGGSEGRR